MPRVKELLEQYAEGRRRQEFGPDYRERQALLRGRAETQGLQQEHMRQGLERGEIEMGDLEERIRIRKAARATLERAVEAGQLDPMFLASPEAAKWIDAAPDRAQKRRTGQLEEQGLVNELLSEPSPGEAAEQREADLAATRSRTGYWQAQAEAAGRPPAPAGPEKYTGQPVDQAKYEEARKNVLAELGLPKDRPGFWNFGQERLTPEELQAVHLKTIERLQAAGFSTGALEKGGLTVPEGRLMQKDDTGEFFILLPDGSIRPLGSR
jgi:hypothetical protein